MAFVIDESYLPASLTAKPMTDEEFVAFCGEYPDLFFEMTAAGEIIVMLPSPTMNGVRITHIIVQFDAWAERNRQGLTTGPSAGFVLPNGARRSADLAWTLKSRVAALPAESRNGFWHLSPDFVIELKSDSDRLPTLRAKMTEWIENGTQLAWLIDADARAVEVYRAGDTQPVVVEGAESIAASEPLEGFVLQLASVWDPLA